MRQLMSLVSAVLLCCDSLAQDKPAEPKKEDPPKDSNQLPIKATKKIEFDTDEGTWMSLDLSPDGETIVFELMGDLYTMPIAGGTATRIVDGIHYDGMPRFSPDGKRIAFISDRSGAENVWLIDPDGKNPKTLTEGRNTHMVSPSWTPDGKYVVVSKSTGYLGSYKLAMIDTRGGSGLSIGPGEPGLTGNRGISRMGAITSPDGRFLYYAQRVGPWTYDVKFPQWQIYRHDLERGDNAVVTGASGSAMRPAISPDGKTLLYATRWKLGTGLKARDLKTGEERWVAYPIDRDDQESRSTRDTIASFAFTPDGKAILIPLQGKIQRLDLASGKATVIPFQAKVAADISDTIHFKHRVVDDATVTAKIIRYPSYSPDGKRIVFGAFNRLWIAEAGGQPRRLTDSTDYEFMPTWSPDGSSIAFVTWSRNGGYVCSISPDGGRPVRLTREAGYYENPVFSRDGKKIAFLAGTVQDGLNSTLHMPQRCLEESPETEVGNTGAATPPDIRWIPASGGDATFVANSQYASSLQTAKDPSRLYLVSGDGLFSIRFDGTDRKQHIKVTGKTSIPNPSNASDIRISPDGTQALVEIENKLFVVTVPRTGDPLTLNISGSGGPIPVKKVAAEGGDYLGWSPDAKSVSWSMGKKLYKLDLAAEKPAVQELICQAPRYKPTGTVVLRGARIITMRGDTVLPKGDVVVEGNRIAFVGAKATVPKSTRVIDVSGKTIAPGFVDVHSHWFGSEVRLPQSWGYAANLAYGVTTNRDPQSGGTGIYDYAESIETGEAIGPRIYTTGPGVFYASGLDDAESTKNLLKRYAEAYDTHTLKQYVTGDRMTRQWVAMACKELGITPTTEGALDLKMGMTEMADGFSGHEHGMPIYPLYKDVVELISKTNTFYTPTLLVTYGAPSGENYWYANHSPSDDQKLLRFVPEELINGMARRRTTWNLPEEYGFTKVAEQCAKVVRAGGKVCLGSHGQLQGLGAHWELWSLASGGMTPLEALRCASLYGAEAIGLDQDLGSIETGKLADLLIFDKNPLDDIRNSASLTWVMKNGELFNADTLDRVWPSPKKAPTWWQPTGPSQEVGK